MKTTLDFKNLDDLTKYFNTEAKCVLYFEKARWNGERRCPHCGSAKTYVCKGVGKYKCGDCRKLFSITTGTYFENTKLPLRKWLIAMYLCINHKKGISSLQLADTLGITQKSAWFVLHRIRAIVSQQVPEMLLSGMVEADETFIGGKEKNKHKDKKPKTGTWRDTKKVVLGAVERGGKVVAKSVPNRNAKNVKPFITKHVAEGARLVTDEWYAYNRLNTIYSHDVIKHMSKIYAIEDIHTNCIENFWSGVKRCVNGTYHQLSEKHLQAYLNEFSFRYNNRDISNNQRFLNALDYCHGRLKYGQLIA